MTEAIATEYVTIGTGDVSGVYYPTGSSISKLVNRKIKEYNIRATVEATSGSVFNINAIMAGDLEFGIVQSDRQFQAFNGTADWENQPLKKLRAVFAIHPETVTLVSAVDSGITSVAALRGKRVNIGNPGSGQRGNALDLLAVAGISAKTDLRAGGVKASESSGMLQADQIDAFFYTVGHPNDSVKKAVSGVRQVQFVPIDKVIVDQLIGKFSYYSPSVIPISAYPGVANKKDVLSFGVRATFVTSIDVSEDIVYAITKEVFENFEEFKTLHPAYVTLTKSGMLEGLSAPIHPGAMRYYKEAGLK